MFLYKKKCSYCCHLSNSNSQDREKADGVTSTGKPVAETTANEGNQKCEKCKKVCESLLVCTVRFFSYFNVLFQLGKKKKNIIRL